MKSIDFRNCTFRHLRETTLTGQRLAVYHAWVGLGPCTTRELSLRTGIDLLNVRPRTTELLQVGALVEADAQPAAGEGRYRARTHHEWEAWHAEQIGDLVSTQQQLL